MRKLLSQNGSNRHLQAEADLSRCPEVGRPCIRNGEATLAVGHQGRRVGTTTAGSCPGAGLLVGSRIPTTEDTPNLEKKIRLFY
jgi:hypothetical protein